MDVFTIGLIVLLVMTAIFYVAFFTFIYYWHLVKITYIIVPVIFTFEFFAAGFLVVALVAFLLTTLPTLANFL